ncbi:MAG: amidohydrolase family protein [Gemmatimonadaceae bacterium]|nr:amidohydrolase family protein [Gemmatimonadaceae bacterium]
MNEHAARAWCTSYRAAWVLPVSAPPIRNGAVVVEGGRVAWVGGAGEEPARFGARPVELGDAILGPGLVNAHSHLDLHALRGLLDGLPFFEWIRAIVAARAFLSPDDLATSARAGVLEGLLSGITTFADTAPTGASFDALCGLGARGIAFLEAFGPDPAGAQAALKRTRALVAGVRARETALVRAGVSPHAPYSVSGALYAALAGYARSEGLPLATHVAESEAESSFVRDGAGPFAEMLRRRAIETDTRATSPVALIERSGALGRNALLIHCVRCDARDIGVIAHSGAAVATCPFSNRYFGHGTAPVADFLAAGVRVGIGTDSMASNKAMHLLAEASAAGFSGMEAQWAAASLGGALALGLDREVGSLDPGKAADLAALASPGAGASAVLPAGAGPGAVLVTVAGVERVRDGQFIGDSSTVTAQLESAVGRLSEWRTRNRAVD